MADATFDNVSWEEVKTFEVPLWNFDESPILIGKLVKVIDTKTGYNSRMYHFETADGKTTAVWASYNIARAMADVAVGTLVRIEFKGEQALEDGKTLKLFSVSVAK
jgi:hypothetical protein